MLNAHTPASNFKSKSQADYSDMYTILVAKDFIGKLYPSQTFTIFLTNILDSRKRFLLGMESGGDVKFLAVSGPVRPHFSLFSSILINLEK